MTNPSTDEPRGSALLPSVLAAAFFFAVAFRGNLPSLTKALSNGFTGAVIFGGACFLFARSARNSGTNFAWWQWAPYFTGALIGSLSCLYWAVMYALHVSDGRSLPFFGQAFHRRTFRFGLVVLPLLVLALLFRDK